MYHSVENIIISCNVPFIICIIMYDKMLPRSAKIERVIFDHPTLYKLVYSREFCKLLLSNVDIFSCYLSFDKTPLSIVSRATIEFYIAFVEVRLNIFLDTFNSFHNTDIEADEVLQISVLHRSFSFISSNSQLFNEVCGLVHFFCTGYDKFIVSDFISSHNYVDVDSRTIYLNTVFDYDQFSYKFIDVQTFLTQEMVRLFYEYLFSSYLVETIKYPLDSYNIILT